MMEKVAILNARVACAMIRAMGMQAENQDREHCGYSLAYTEAAFNKVIEEEGVHWNAVYKLLYE